MDIVERLRAGHKYSGVVDPVEIEAAAEIERLREAKRAAGLIADERSRENVGLRNESLIMEGTLRDEIARLQAALKPFADRSNWDTSSHIEEWTGQDRPWLFAANALEQSAPIVSDTTRMTWLQDQIVDTIYLDDGRIIDVRGGNLRNAIDVVSAPKQGGAPCPKE